MCSGLPEDSLACTLLVVSSISFWPLSHPTSTLVFQKESSPQGLACRMTVTWRTGCEYAAYFIVRLFQKSWQSGVPDHRERMAVSMCVSSCFSASCLILLATFLSFPEATHEFDMGGEPLSPQTLAILRTCKGGQHQLTASFHFLLKPVIFYTKIAWSFFWPAPHPPQPSPKSRGWGGTDFPLFFATTVGRSQRRQNVISHELANTYVLGFAY